jgi:hypothetical protein
MDQYIDNFTHGVGTIVRQLGSMTAGMSVVHWALFAVIVVGVGVICMRGNPVQRT